jgi:hypothetical protein
MNFLSPDARRLYAQLLAGDIGSDEAEGLLVTPASSFTKTDRLFLARVLANLRGDEDALLQALEAMHNSDEPTLVDLAQAELYTRFPQVRGQRSIVGLQVCSRILEEIAEDQLADSTDRILESWRIIARTSVEAMLLITGQPCNDRLLKDGMAAILALQGGLAKLIKDTETRRDGPNSEDMPSNE